MNILDDIFYEKEFNGDELKQLEKQLLKKIFYCWFISSVIWIIALLDGDDLSDINNAMDLLIGIPISLIVSPLASSLMLALLVALFPYKYFSYSKRFPRAFLLISISFYIGLILYGIGTIITNYV